MKQLLLIYSCLAIHSCVTLTDSDFLRIGQLFNEATHKTPTPSGK